MDILNMINSKSKGQIKAISIPLWFYFHFNYFLDYSMIISTLFTFHYVSFMFYYSSGVL